MYKYHKTHFGINKNYDLVHFDTARYASCYFCLYWNMSLIHEAWRSILSWLLNACWCLSSIGQYIIKLTRRFEQRLFDVCGPSSKLTTDFQLYEFDIEYIIACVLGTFLKLELLVGFQQKISTSARIIKRRIGWAFVRRLMLFDFESVASLTLKEKSREF